MNRHISKNHLFFFFSILFSLSIFTACSNTVPDISNARLSIIFDYESYDALPQARMSVFVEANSNPRRFETITVSSNKNEYVWEADDLIFAADDNVKYCGFTNFVLPQNLQIPSGEYTIIFRQSDDEQKEIKRNLNYDKTLYETKVSDVAQVMKKYYSTRMLTIYDNSKKVLYYGPRSADLSDARGIWNNYRDAAEFQESWVNQNGTVICNMPLEKVVPGN